MDSVDLRDRGERRHLGCSIASTTRTDSRFPLASAGRGIHTGDMVEPLRGSWVSLAKPGPEPRLRLICFPHAGGGAGVFRSWSEALPDTVDICAVRLPGRESRYKEKAFRHIPPSSTACSFPALSPLLDRPFVVFGCSVGAIIGFEFVRRVFAERGTWPAAFIPAASLPPQMIRRTKATGTLDDSQFIRVLKAYNGTPPEVLENRELLELYLPTIRADFSLVETYGFEPEPCLDCPVVVFGGESD